MFLLLLACTGVEPVAPEPAPKLAAPDLGSMTARTVKAEKRLADSPAGELLWLSMEAHGGLGNWYAVSPIAFRFDYRPVDPTKKVRDSEQLVDTWSSRATHRVSGNEQLRFGWDGSQAWKIEPEGQVLEINPRFWSMTPAYFVGVPFVFADPGTVLELGPDETVRDQLWNTVKVSYESGVGDAPDDWYVVYLHPETHRVGGLRYVVSYPGFFPDGGHSPEKWMAYNGELQIGDVTVAASHQTFTWGPEGLGDKVTDITVSGLESRKNTLDEAFQVPEGAVVLTGY